MKEITLTVIFLLSKVGMMALAYLAASRKVEHAGWFVFLAIVYALGAELKVFG